MLIEFKEYREWMVRILVAVTAISGYVINKYFDWNERLTGVEEMLLYSGLIAIAVGAEFWLARLPASSKWARNKLLKNKNIEGVWIEMTKKKGARKRIYSIGYCFIRIEHDMFVIDGHAFRFDTHDQDNWKSISTILNSDGDFDIMYKLSSSKTGSGDINGYCKYSFTISPENIAPDYYSGSWVYPIDHETYFCEGRRIKDKSLATAIQSQHQRDFQKCNELCQKYFTDSYPPTS
jgi:hypothetical protein